MNNNLGQVISPIENVNSLASRLADIGDVIIYLLIGLAVIYIVWNVVSSMINGSDMTKKKEALNNVGYGVLGLAIIVSIWGIVSVLTNTFRTKTDVPRDRFPTANFIDDGQNSNVNLDASSENLLQEQPPLYDAPDGFGQQNAGQI